MAYVELMARNRSRGLGEIGEDSKDQNVVTPLLYVQGQNPVSTLLHQT